MDDYETIIAQYISSSREIGEMTTDELKQFVEAIIETKMGTPTGSILAQMGNEAPSGYLFCDGSEYQIKDYQNLADYINRQFGSYNYFGGDGITTFAVPNLQGEFLRGTGTNNHTNQGNGANIGVHQDATEELGITNYGSTHSILQFPKLVGSKRIENTDKVLYTSNHFYNIVSDGEGDETSGKVGVYTSRPTNTSVLYCIKY